MPEILLSDAISLAINVLRDVAESQKMPSGISVDLATADLHADASDTLEAFLSEFLENSRKL